MTDQWVSNLEDLRDQRHVVEEFGGGKQQQQRRRDGESCGGVFACKVFSSWEKEKTSGVG